MKKILAFGASNSKNSINKAFATFAASQIRDVDVQIIDLNDFEMPIYSIDIEKESGIPEPAWRFKDIIKDSDAIVISFAEHNGHYTVAFKNIFDWVSRIDRNIWMNKPMFLLATAPGPRGAKRVLESAIFDMGRKNGEIVASFSLPSFRENFSSDSGILDAELKDAFNTQLSNFMKYIHQPSAALES
jgi:NAD(P)H-dependent FMN reductase